MPYRGCVADFQAIRSGRQPRRVPVVACSEEFDVRWHGRYTYEEFCQDAEKMTDAGSLSQMLRYMESLVYVPDESVLRKVQQMGGDYVQKLKALPAEQLAGKKDEAKSIAGNFKYMTRWKLLPATFAPAADLDALIKQQGWDKEKKR